MEQPYTPDPFKNFTPRQNPQKPVVKSVTSESPLTAAELAGLEGMDREGLIGLVRRCNADKVRVLMMNEDQVRQAFLDRMAIEGITNPDIKDAISAMTARLNRTEGTPIQRQEIKAQVQTISIQADQELLARARARLLADKSYDNS